MLRDYSTTNVIHGGGVFRRVIAAARFGPFASDRACQWWPGGGPCWVYFGGADLSHFGPLLATQEAEHPPPMPSPPPHGRLALLKRGPATPARVHASSPLCLSETDFSLCAYQTRRSKRKGARALKRHVHVHVHVQWPSRQDAQPPVPWRLTAAGADVPAVWINTCSFETD